MTAAEFLFLGTGGSAGVPVIGCSCSVCTSSDAHNKRLRPSGLLTCAGKTLLIDSGPDFRYQALRYGINALDGLLLTHSHFDHIAGLDELRIYYLKSRKPLPVLLSEPTLLDLKHRYEYLFREKRSGSSLTAQLDYQIIQKPNSTFLGFTIGSTQYEQGGMPITGFRFGTLAYITDIRTFPETIFADLAGVKILILSTLKNEPSYMHFSIEEAITFSRKVGAEKTYLTHTGHELDYALTNALLPEDIQLAYDGLKLRFDYDRR